MKLHKRVVRAQSFFAFKADVFFFFEIYFRLNYMQFINSFRHRQLRFLYLAFSENNERLEKKTLDDLQAKIVLKLRHYLSEFVMKE